MSLIEEALRKQERDAGRRPPAGAPGAPSLPPAQPSVAVPSAHAPPRFHPGVRQPPSRMGLAFAAAGLLLLLAAGAVFLQATHWTRPAGPATAAVPVAMPAPAPSAPARLPAPTLAPKPAPFEPAVVPVAVVPSALTPSALPPSNATTAAATPPAGDAAVLPPPPPEAVNWPEIVIKGFAFVNRRPLLLLADGLQVETGTTAPNGVRLLDAGPGWFRVSYRGQIRTYRQNGRSYLACTNEAAN